MRITYFSLILLLLSPIPCLCQEIGDKKISVTITDTTNIYNKVRGALGKNDYIIKEDGNKDTVSTHAAEIKNIAGYLRLTAIIEGNSVTLSGVYSLTKMDDFGYTRNSKKYKPIVYYKNSKTWRQMAAVASALGGTFSYSK